MEKQLNDNRGITLVVVLMTMAILLSVIGAGLLFSGINTKITGSYQRGISAFYAADAGIGQAISQLSANTATALVAFGPTDLGNGLKYRSGPRAAGTPQPMQFVGTRQGTGYSLKMKKEREPKTRTLVLLYSSQPQSLQICFKSKPINKIKSR